MKFNFNPLLPSGLQQFPNNLTDIETRSHTSLTDIGTNTHAQIDSHIGLVNPHIDWTLASQGTIDDTNIEDKFLRNDANDTTSGELTAKKFIINTTALGSYNNIVSQLNVSETGGVAANTYKGIFFDLDYNTNVSIFDQSIITGISIDIDTTRTGGTSFIKPQLINADLTAGSNTNISATDGEQPVYLRVNSSAIATSFASGAFWFGVVGGANTTPSISTRSYISGSGAGNISAYMGYFDCLTGFSGQAAGVYAFGVPKATASSCIGMLSEPIVGGVGGTPGAGKVMSFKGSTGHLLISAGSAFIRKTITNTPDAFASTHLTHTSNNGDIYAEGALEIDGVAYFDNATTAIQVGAGAAGVDYRILFDGETNDGVITWMEDEDYFQFADDIMLADSEKLKLGTGVDMDLYYDGTNGYLHTDLVAASDLHIDCGTAKTLVLDIPVYNDANVGSLVLVTGGTLPGVVELLESDGGASGIYSRGFAIGEQGSGSIEFPHDYKEGSDIVFHIHWVGQDAPSGTDNVKWQLKYSVTRDGVVTPAATTTVSATDTAFDTQYEWMRTDVATITGTNFKIGDQFNFTILRIAADGDAYAGEAIVATIGFHYQCDTLGSRQIGTK